METTEIIQVFLFGLLLFVIPVLLILELVKFLFRDFYIIRKEKNLILYYKTFPNRIDSVIQNILQNKFAFYSCLSADNKLKFYVRLCLFLKEKKKFKPCQLNEVTVEMKVLIAASAIQLTFGLEKFIFYHFKTILVYPKAFLSKYDRNFHKGDVNLKGAISLSYEDFIEGYKNPSDAINLGLHEMAHALELEFNLKDEYDAFFAAYYEKWIKSAFAELTRMNYGQSEFLRKYASRNIKEFIAVCVENFFERPVALKDKLPEIYRHISYLLNQNPITGKIGQNIRIGKSTEIKDHPGTCLLSINNSIKGSLIIPLLFLPISLIMDVYLNIILFAVMMFIIFLIFSIIILVSYNNVFLYDNVLVIKPYLYPYKSERSYYLENIVSVTFMSGRANSIKISSINNGVIKKEVFSISFKGGQANQLASNLKLLKVMVRNN